MKKNCRSGEKRKSALGLAVLALAVVLTIVWAAVKEKQRDLRHILDFESESIATGVISTAGSARSLKMTEILLETQFVGIYPGENAAFSDGDLQRLMSSVNSSEDDSNLLLDDDGLTIEAGQVMDCLVKLIVKEVSYLEGDANYRLQVRIQPQMRDGLLVIEPGIGWHEQNGAYRYEFRGASDQLEVRYGQGIAFVDMLWQREKTEGELKEEQHEPDMEYYNDFREKSYDVPYSSISSPRCLVLGDDVYGHNAHYVGDDRPVVGVTLSGEALKQLIQGEQEVYFLLKLAAPPVVMRDRKAEETTVWPAPPMDRLSDILKWKRPFSGRFCVRYFGILTKI